MFYRCKEYTPHISLAKVTFIFYKSFVQFISFYEHLFNLLNIFEKIKRYKHASRWLATT